MLQILTPIATVGVVKNKYNFVKLTALNSIQDSIIHYNLLIIPYTSKSGTFRTLISQTAPNCKLLLAIGYGVDSPYKYILHLICFRNYFVLTYNFI